MSLLLLFDGWRAFEGGLKEAVVTQESPGACFELGDLVVRGKQFRAGQA